MNTTDTKLRSSIQLLKSRATRNSVWGTIIAIFAVLIATVISCYYSTQELSIAGFLQAQQTNSALWVLDGMPFVFAIWGQYVSSIMTNSVNSMVVDHTADLRRKTEILERQAIHDATHDPLTNLPNRILLRDRLEQALLTNRRSDAPLALMILDVDRFKEINDTLGHYNGDRLLKQVAIRLREVVFSTDTLARLGGDEFAILLPSFGTRDVIERVVKKIQRVFDTPFVINKMQLEVQASIGISVAPEHGQDMETLLQRADVAMYAAKEEKRRFFVYDSSMDKHSSRRLSLLVQLRQAIENDDLVLYYQPKVDARRKQTLGVEALVRWNHQQFGMVPPDEFIHLAEQSGLIIELSRWVLRKASDQAMSWLSQGRHLEIAVNLSPSTLLDPELPDFMAGLLAAHQLPKGSITLEITESSLVRDPKLALEVLNQLASLGISISIDDFGTGYSSLAYLKKMPANELKIDQTFVSDMLKNESDAAIVRATIDLAHNLGLKVVAEGVENAETANTLTEMQCDSLQGYHFSPPLPPNQLAHWLAESKA